MSASQALKLARDAGVRLGIDGDALTLKAAAAPPPAVLELLARHKVEVLALLRPGADGWSGEDWRAFFDDRADMALSTGRVSRGQAEADAYAWCIAEWLMCNPVRSPPSRCVGCGGPERAHDLLVPFGVASTGHAWLHQRCWPSWRVNREAQAAAALATLGIHPTTETS